jgi:rhomboid family GlyGly-CTERM serine protease
MQTKTMFPLSPSAARCAPSVDLWVWAALIAAVNLAAWFLGGASRLAFIPSAVAAGEWWRLITSPLAHVSAYHFILDGAGFLMVYASLRERKLSVRTALVASAMLGSLLAAWIADPRVSAVGVCGLSGCAHGLMAVGGAEMIAAGKDRVERRIGWIVFLLVAAKSVYEVLTGSVLFAFLHFGYLGAPVAACHIGGIAGALAAWFVLRRLPSTARGR